MKRWIHSATEVKASEENYAGDWKDDPNADLYVVRIWHESDPGHDTVGPTASEEIIETVATSPQEAIEYAKRQWSGPIDRIEIVDVNPEYDDEPLPFYASEDVSSDKHLSGCSFDFDLGDSYDSKWLDSAICDVFDSLGLYCEGTDFREVEYPGNKLYSQCGVDFAWSGSYDAEAIEDELENLIEDQGGNFFGIDFYSLDD